MSTAAETSSGSPTRDPHRVPEVVVLLGVGLAVAALTAIPFLLRHTFYYRGDNPESFVPRGQDRLRRHATRPPRANAVAAPASSH